jgi:quercetin dioxygenase-like cupin family protein
MRNWQQEQGGVKPRLGRVLAVIVSAISAAALLAPMVLGSSGSGILNSQILGHRARLSESVQINQDRIKFQTKDPVDVQMQTITFAPGGNSGWHHHPGVILVIVESGAVTIYDENCQQVKVVTAGNAFVESGSEPMLVRNEGTSNAVVYNAQVAPTEVPSFRVEDDPPPCAG